MTGLAVSFMLVVAFLKLEQRAAKPLFPPHIWKLNALVSGTAVMLAVTGILVGTVFLASIFMQTVLGYSALRSRSCRSPWPPPPEPSLPGTCWLT